MLCEYIDAYRRLYIRDRPSRGDRRVRSRPDLYFRKERNRSTYSLAVVGSQSTILDEIHQILHDDELMEEAKASLRLPADEIRAGWLVSFAIFFSLQYTAWLASVSRIYVSCLDNLDAGILRAAHGRAQWVKSLFLTLSGGEDFHLARRLTTIRHVSGTSKIVFSRTGNPIEVLFDGLAESHSAAAIFARRFGLRKEQAALSLKAIREAFPGLGARNSGDSSLGRDRYDPQRLLQLWHTAPSEYFSCLRSALEAYLLTPSPLEPQGPPTSLVVPREMLEVPTGRARLSRDRRLYAEYVVDTTVISIVRTAADIDAIFEAFADEPDYFSKFMTIMVCHFFNNRQLIASLVRSGQYARYPQAGWMGRAELWATFGRRPYWA